MNVIYLIGALLGVVYARDIPLIQDEGWQLWKMAHKKNYTDVGAERVRYIIWQDNLKKIEEHNQLGKSYTLGMNHFGDMTGYEFGSLMTCYQHKGKMGGNLTSTSENTYLPAINPTVPDQVEWQTLGYVTPVKNQGHCGSCWSFSTTGALEGQMFRATQKLVSLSEQNLVDCSGEWGNNGCNGGLMDNAFKYIKDNGGIDTEESYPYEAVQGECRYNPQPPAKSEATVVGFQDVPQGNEEALKEAIGLNGPVSVAIDASHFSFQFYKHGVYDEPACSPENLDHGVLATGYGNYRTHTGDIPFWWVKNSWGPGWGHKGFIRMSRNKENQCGIASAASYPIVQKSNE